MVYNGPSTGCLTCRRRKVRCSKERPACQNCVKRKQICPGYYDGFDVRHRNQTVATIGRATHQHKLILLTEKGTHRAVDHGCAQSPGSSFDSNSTNSTSSGESPEYVFPPEEVWTIGEFTLLPTLQQSRSTKQLIASSRSPSPPLYNFCLPFDKTATSLNFFFQHFGKKIDDDGACYSVLYRLAPKYRSAPTSSPLHFATSAVAVNMFNLFNERVADARESRNLYAHAVTALKSRLSASDQCMDDDLLITILLLDFYDMLNSRFGPHIFQNHEHRNGALALLKYRGGHNFKSESNRKVTAAVRNMLVDWALHWHQELSEDALELLEHPSITETPTDKLDILGLKVAAVQIQFRKVQGESFQSHNDANLNRYQNLIGNCLALDADMRKWEDSAPSSWLPVMVDAEDLVPSIRSAGVYGDRCAVYSNIATADVFSKYRERRLALLHTLQQCCHLSPSDVNTQTAETKMIAMQKLVDEQCELLPFFLGDADDSTSLARTITYPCGVKDGKLYPDPEFEHHKSAKGSGGWLGYSILLGLGRLASPNFSCAPIQLRPGQLRWISGQVERIERVYQFSNRTID